MFNFYVVLAGDDKVSDAGRAATWRLKLQIPSLQTKCAINEGSPENMGFKVKTVCGFQTKKRTATLFLTFKKPSGIQGP